MGVKCIGEGLVTNHYFFLWEGLFLRARRPLSRKRLFGRDYMANWPYMAFIGGHILDMWPPMKGSLSSSFSTRGENQSLSITFNLSIPAMLVTLLLFNI